MSIEWGITTSGDAAPRARCAAGMLILGFVLGGLVSRPACAEDTPPNADAVAKELSNPAGSLSSLTNNFEYQTFKGDLPNGNDQEGWSYSFQPVLPFSVGDTGQRIIFRPLAPIHFDSPVFDADEGDFDGSGFELGDISFDLVYAGNEKTGEGRGLLWGLGMAGTLPSATSDAIGGNQWRLGPELFGGITRPWGIVGALVNHQWNFAGSNDSFHSVTAAQYFYAYGLGNGWQIAAGPTLSYDWKAKGGNAWTVPVGVGMAKTAAIGGMHIKFQLQLEKYVVTPDDFGPDWLLKFSVTPVVANPITSLVNAWWQT